MGWGAAEREGAEVSSVAPVFLTDGGSYGTLAAVRDLGAAGFPVTLGDPHRLAPAAWSRHVTRRVACPPVGSGAPFVDWLLAFGEREPGHVLYPTSDDAAWSYAAHRDALGRSFRHRLPSLAAIWSLLGKRNLAEVALRAGLGTPGTVLPRDEGEVERIARELRYPVLLKPQSQAFLPSRFKGKRVDAAGDLPRAWRDLVARLRYPAELRAHAPDVALPLVQAYHPEAQTGIYSVSGFVSAGGRAVLRAAVKVLQRPRRVGIGLCFESAQVDPALAAALLAMCREVGYHGVFEAELIPAIPRPLLIDFNPRFYGQMAFDTARGLPLARLAVLDAVGDAAGLEAALDAAESFDVAPERVYCHRFNLEVMLRVQRASGRLSADEVRRWRAWLARHGDAVVDATLALGDPRPTWADVVRTCWSYARHPRTFLRTLVLDP